MTRSIRGSRRAALLLTGVAAATGLLVSGCGAGQVSETAAKTPSIGGIDLQTPDGFLKVRNASVVFPGVQGYPAGGTAGVNVAIYNDSDRTVTVRVSSDGAQSVTLAGGTAEPVASPSAPATAPRPSASALASVSPAAPTASPDSSATPVAPSGSPVAPSGSPEPAGSATATPAGQPAEVEIPAHSFVLFEQQAGSYLQLNGLNQALPSGGTINMVFDFGNGVTLASPIPVAVPLSPLTPGSPVIERHGGDGGHGDDESGDHSG